MFWLDAAKTFFSAFLVGYNFNPLMAMAGKITVAEVEELVPAGELDPNQIHTPGIFVQRILQGERYEKRIEQRTVRIKE